MKRTVLFAFAAAAMLCACNREIAPDVPAAAGTSLTISFPGTKTILGEDSGSGHQLYWADGDKVCVNGSVSEALSSVPDGSTSATFDFPSATLTAPFKAVYPETIWSSESKVVLPQKAAQGIIPLCGAGSDINLTLGALTSAVRIKIKSDGNDTHNIKRVELASDDAQLSGEFSVDFDGAAITSASGATDDRVVYVEGNWALSGTDALELVIPVPAGTYGLTVKVLDVQGHFMTQSTTSAKTFTKGYIKAFPEIVFTPTGTQFDITINSADDLVKFAQDFNARKLDHPVACLGGNIVFDATTSAAFAATGGIGCKDAEGDNYFNGVLDGSGNTISGYTGGVPLFQYTGSSAEIRNFFFSGEFSFTHPGDAQAFWGTVAGYHRGVLDNVHVNGNINVSEGSISQATYFGGLVGRVVVGAIRHCSYEGNIVVPAGFVVDGQKVYAGGIAGAVTNADGLVAWTDFLGTFDFAGHVISDDRTNPVFMFGGVVGSNAGTVSGCFTEAHNTLTVYNDETFGTIMNRSTLVYHTASGGIAGLNSGTVSDCANRAGLINFITTTGDGGEASDDNSRYIHAGGVVGRNSGTVIRCNNEGAIIQRSSPRIQKLGGIVGTNDATGVVDDCFNVSEGKITLGTSGIGPYSARVAYVGGVIGENHSSSVTSLSNEGDVLISRVENNAGIEVRLGGVIGSNHAALDGGSYFLINNGTVSQNNGSSTNQSTAGYSLGGVVGYSDASVKKLRNYGTVSYGFSAAAVLRSARVGGVLGYLDCAGEMENCFNEGEVSLSLNNQAHTENYIAGILAYCTEGATIKNCDNSGYVHGGNSSKQNGTSCFAGGIVAYLSGPSFVRGCDNTGDVYNNQFTNTSTNTVAAYTGGVAGYVLGTSESPISIISCTHNTADLHSRRGYVGGIVGYGAYVDMKTCSNETNFTGSCWFAGGIAGWLADSQVASSEWKGSSIGTSQIQANGGGGIAAKLDNCIVDNCSSYATDIFHTNSSGVKDADVAGGAIVGISGSGNTIKNCHYKALINSVASNIAGTGSFSGSGNVADL